jgi:hypothetical protein
MAIISLILTRKPKQTAGNRTSKKHIQRLLLFFLLGFCFTNCKKTYECKGTDGSGEHVFTCKNCSVSEKEKYQQEIIDKGYGNVSCVRN